MKIDRKSFFRIFRGSFWDKLGKTIVPFDDTPNKNDFLENLFQDITQRTYNPSQPREYIVVDKHNGISRYVPTFTRKDYCVYYLCVKLLEKEIAGNRVEGTFGGWTLGNEIKLKEDEEILTLEYVPFNSLQPWKWNDEWQTFQNIARRYSEKGDWKYFVFLDIANFYDSINLTILERQIRHSVAKNKQEVVTLLFHFLRNWNRKIEGYSLKTIGIPQDEVADCSRILANFYLQEYDAHLKTLSEKNGAKVIRYADDHIIYARNKRDAKKVLFDASRELLRLGLNLNSSKVKEFGTIIEFNEYWAYDIFDKLKDKNDNTSINSAIETFFIRLDSGIPFRDSSVLKRILNIDPKLIKPKYKHRLLALFLDPSFLSLASIWYFRRIKNFVENTKDLYITLDELIEEVPYNSFHYRLFSFYQKDRKDWDPKKLLDRIEEIRLR